MEAVNSKEVVKVIPWYAGSAAVAVAIILPLIYFTLSYQNQAGTVDAEAEINWGLTSQIVNATPERWRFQQLILTDFVQRRPRRILDNDSRVVAEDTDPLDPPILTGYS